MGTTAAEESCSAEVRFWRVSPGENSWLLDPRLFVENMLPTGTPLDQSAD
jgi:hypothetical protein